MQATPLVIPGDYGCDLRNGAGFVVSRWYSGVRVGNVRNARIYNVQRQSFAEAGAQTSAHHCSTLALIVSRTSRVLARRSSCVPWKLEGSAKPQCNRWVMPGKIGQRSALASSHTVMT